MAPNQEGASKMPIHIAVLGASSVGKTTLTLQFITGAKVGSESCTPTIETSFRKELRLNTSTDSSNLFSGLQTSMKGSECLWKMDDIDQYRMRSSQDEARLWETKAKSKISKEYESIPSDIETILKVTDTASYKAAPYNPRKSLRERIVMKFTPRRRPPVSHHDSQVRKKYFHVANDTEKKTMHPVPSFIYRTSDMTSQMHDDIFASADAFVLVYSMRDRKSFEILSKIRNDIREARGCFCSSNSKQNKRWNEQKNVISTSRKSPRMSCECKNKVFPSVFVVGTHMDLTTSTNNDRPEISTKSTDISPLKSTINNTFSPRRLCKRLSLRRQVSLAVELLSTGSRSQLAEVTAEHVEDVVGNWEECVGYAEISSDSTQRVKRIFKHLSLEVVRNRMYGAKRMGLSSSRNRLDSVLSVFNRRGESKDQRCNLLCCFSSCVRSTSA